MRRPLVFSAALLVASAICARASADATGADLRTFRPSTDKTGTLATESADTPGPWKVQVGLWASYATPILKIHEPDGTDHSIKNQLILDPFVSLGITARAAIGVTMPFLVAQSGEASSIENGSTLATHAAGNPTLTGKATVFKPANDALGGPALALLARFQLPVGSKTALVADDGLVSELRALFTYDYAHTILFALTAGYRMRAHRHDVADVTVGDTVPWGVTLTFKPRALGWDDKGHWIWNVEARGEIGAVPNKFLSDSRLSPVAVGPSIRYEITQNWSFFLGVETGLNAGLGNPRVRGVLGFIFAPVIIDDDNDGVPDDVDECPGLPGDKNGPQPGCPSYESTPAKKPSSDDELGPPADADNDSVPDAQDKCPNEPENFDGIDDADGCPEPASKLAVADRDRDGVADDNDKCPDEPETVNGFQDDDGCPEIDSDNDTFLDAVDKCPNDAETFNGFQDDDGCADTAPKPIVLVIEGGKDGEGDPVLTLARKIAFDGQNPAKSAEGDLRALAAWLLAHPGYRLKIGVQAEPGKDGETNATARAAAIAQAVIAYAHTGGAGEAMSWAPKLAPKTSNVQIDVTKSIGLTEGSTEKP